MSMDDALESKSLGCLYGKRSPDGELQPPHPLRRACVWLCAQPWYGNGILVLILANCIILAMQTPTFGPAVVCHLPEDGETFDKYKHNCADPTDPTKLMHDTCQACQLDGLCSCNGPVLPGFDMMAFGEQTEMFFTLAFTFEALIRIIALGFCMHKGSYLRNGWNWLDWVVVVMSWASFIPGVGNFSAIRTVRVFRPLRTMSRIPGMGVIVGALMRSMIPLGSVVMLCTAIFFLFGILASQVWTEMPKTHCGSYSVYYDMPGWSNIQDGNNQPAPFVCHSLDTYLPVQNSTKGTYKRCGCDQLGESPCPGAAPAELCQGFRGVQQKKMHWFQDGTGISEFDSSYSALPQSKGMELDAFIQKYPDEIVDRDEDGTAAAGDAMFTYDHTGDVGCGCGEICTTHLEFYCDSMGSVSFDHIGHTMMTIFQCVTLEGWTDIMYTCSNLDNPLSGSLSVIYWCALILFAGLFVINIALAVIADAHAEAEKAEKAEHLKKKRDKLYALYIKIDTDGSGSVSSAELKAGLLGEGKYSGIVKTEKEVDDIIARGDADGDGELSLDEFIACFPDLADQVNDNESKAAKAQARLAAGKNQHSVGARLKNGCRKFWARDAATQEKPMFAAVQRLVNSDGFTSFIMIFIGINTALLAAESHSDDLCTELELISAGKLGSTCQDPQFTDFLEASNVVLSLFFLGEMLLKIWGLGIVMYLSDSFNVFDAFIVITSIVELLLQMAGSGSGGGFITVLRAGRLFRIFKLARAWDALQQVILTVTRSFEKILPLSIILLLFMFIFSLLGMQLYGGGFMFVGRAGDCYSWEEVENGCSIPRANFDTFGVSMVTIFQMMTGEDWNMVMYDGIASTGGGSFLYFAIIVVIGNFLILNLFLTILLSGFEDPEDDEEVDAAAMRDKLYDIFKRLDVDNSNTVSIQELTDGLIQDKILTSEDEVKERFGDAGEIKFHAFMAAFPEYEEMANGADEPSLLRKLLCCLKVTQAPAPATEELGLQGPAIADNEGDVPAHTALFCLAPTNGFRIFAFKFINSAIFENIVLFCIVLSSLALAYQNPTAHGGPHANDTAAQVLLIADYIFLAIFTVEMAMKHIALGVVGHARAYWRDPWNAMDGFIVVMAYVGILAADLPQLKPLRAIRTMRALRPLRALKMFPGMKVAVNCLLKSIPRMLPIGMVSFLFFFVFAILGLQLYAGKLWYCDMSAANEDGALELIEALYKAKAQDPPEEIPQSVWKAYVSSPDGLGYEDVASSADVLAQFPYMDDVHVLSQAAALIAACTAAPGTTPPVSCATATTQSDCATLADCVFEPSSQLGRRYFMGDGEDVYQWEEINVSGDEAGKKSSPARINRGYDTFCTDPRSFHGSECTRAECRLAGGSWTNQMTHFDNVAESLLCLFEMSTTEGWPTVMWNTVDSGEVGRQPVFAQGFTNIAYFVLFLIVGNFFVLNLFVGSVIDEYLSLEQEEKDQHATEGVEYHAGDAMMTSTQREWVAEQRQAIANGEDSLTVEPKREPPSNPIRRLFFNIVDKPLFDHLITVCILVNIVIMSMKHRDMSPTFEDQFMFIANWFFTIAFILEAVFKLIAWFPKEYFTGVGSGWNQFDFFLVVVSIVSKIFDFGSFATMFRVFRVLRIIKLVKRAKELKRLMHTILISLPALGNVGSLLLLLFFIYAILGVNFFYAACAVPPYYTVDASKDASWTLTVSSDNTPAAFGQFTFDPCADVDDGYGFDGFMSVNFEHNVALWGAHAADENNDGRVSKEEYDRMRGALSSKYADGSDVMNAWPGGRDADVTIDAVSERPLLVTLFAQDWALNKGGDSDIGFHAWAAAGETPWSKADAEQDKVGAVDYVEKSEFIKAVAATTKACEDSATLSDARICYGTNAGENDLRWIYDPTLKSDKANKLWCTELTLKTSEYSEVTQNILDGQDGAPAHSEPACENIGYDANFSNFARAFITLIR